jgi:peptidoglycan hydrolase-like protein with peptidoglycan-binding domain
MIGKLQTDVTRSLITEGQPQPEQTAQVSERPQTEANSNGVQQSQLANARKGESLFSTTMQRAVLDAALSVAPKPEPATETTPPVGATPPDERLTVIGYGNLKLNDEGPQVARLQDDLNIWRKMNGLPPIAKSGTFTTETQDAVKEFQRATHLKETGEVESNTGLRLGLEMNSEFQELNGSVKEKISGAYSALQNDPKGRDNLLNLIEQKPFLYLVGSEAQEAAINGLMVNPGNTNVADSIKHYLTDAAILENDPNYDNLTQEIKEKAMNTMFYRIALMGGVGADGRHNNISGLVADPSFGKRSLEEQRQLLDIVTQNDDGPIGMNSTAHNVKSMMNNSSFQNLSAELQTQVIDIMQNNIAISSYSGNWPDKDTVQNMRDLITSPRFINASEEEKKQMLERERKKVFLGDN